MRSFAETDLGLERASNQDAAYVSSSDGVEVLAVADGMGGAPAGHVASAMVIAAFERPPQAGQEPADYLCAAFEQGRRAIEDDVADHPEHEGMGSTVAAAVVRGDQVWVANIGDSRAYLWQGGELRQLSEDHNVAAQGVREGWLDPQQARVDPQRHLLTRVIGGATSAEQSPPYVDGPFSLDGESALVLVTDGVSGVLDERQIGEQVAKHRGPEIARALIECVHRAGAPDNIGIALLDERL